MDDDEFVFIESDITQSSWVDVKKVAPQPHLKQQQQQQQQQQQPILPIYRIINPFVSDFVPQQEQQSIVEQQQQLPKAIVDQVVIEQQPKPIVEKVVEEQQVPTVISMVNSPPPFPLPKQEEPEWLKGKEKTNFISTDKSDVKYVSNGVVSKPYVSVTKSSSSYTSSLPKSSLSGGMTRISLAQLNGDVETKPYVSPSSNNSTTKSYVTATKSNNSYSYSF